MTTLLNGKKLAEKIRKRIRRKLDSSEKEPTLAPILIGDYPTSKKYVELKRKDCKEVGIGFEAYNLPSDTSQKEILKLIKKLNESKHITGIIVQLPIPPHLEQFEILEKILPSKDVDGLHPYNIGKLWSSAPENGLTPCTPKGILRLIEYYNIDLKGKEAVIINRSGLVGKPLSKLLLDRDATVTICHSKTKDIKKHTLSADVLITAVGRRPDFVVTEDMIPENSVVIDVGMNYLEEGVYGDVEFEKIKDRVSHITPVPGGVGPMTRTMLLENIMIASGEKIEIDEKEEGI